MEKSHLIVPIMNTRVRHDEIWIATANIKIDQIRSSIKDANYGYVTVLGLAKGKIDFREKVAKALSLQHFMLLRLQEAEKFSNRIQKFEVENSILKLAEELISGDIEVKFSTFHTYD
jgi:altronate dehydratase